MHFASNSIHTLIILKFQTFCTKQKTASSSVQWTRNEYNLRHCLHTISLEFWNQTLQIKERKKYSKHKNDAMSTVHGPESTQISLQNFIAHYLWRQWYLSSIFLWFIPCYKVNSISLHPPNLVLQGCHLYTYEFSLLLYICACSWLTCIILWDGRPSICWLYVRSQELGGLGTHMNEVSNPLKGSHVCYSFLQTFILFLSMLPQPGVSKAWF